MLGRQITCIAAYSATSIGIVYFNRWVFTVGYPYPVFISMIQQLIGLLLYYVIALIGVLTNIPLLRKFHFEKIHFWTMIQCGPQIVTFSLMVGLANLCLQYVQVSTYQVARSLSLLFSIVLTRALVGTTPSRAALLGVVLICSGFVINSFDPETLSVTGLALGAGASFFQALNGVLVSKNMTLFENDGQRLLLYNLAGGTITMLPLVFLFREFEAFTYLPFDPFHQDFAVRLTALILSGVLCILINLTTFLCIGATSPVTMTVVGFSKSIVQSVGGIVFFGDIATLESLIALATSLAGTGIYSAAQIQQKIAAEEELEMVNQTNDQVRDLEQQLPVTLRETQSSEAV